MIIKPMMTTPTSNGKRVVINSWNSPRIDDESSWGHMVPSIMVAEDVGVRMMIEYFEIEASKVTP